MNNTLLWLILAVSLLSTLLSSLAYYKASPYYLDEAYPKSVRQNTNTGKAVVCLIPENPKAGDPVDCGD